MSHLWHYLAIGGAGFLGAIARHALQRLCVGWLGLGSPVGILFINLLGSLLLGLFIAWTAALTLESQTLRLAVTVGFLGAFTTFSTWMYESHDLMEKGAWSWALANLLGSVILGLAAVRAGLWAGGK